MIDAYTWRPWAGLNRESSSLEATSTLTGRVRRAISQRFGNSVPAPRYRLTSAAVSAS